MIFGTALKAVVAWSYLISAVMVSPLLVELLLEAVGILHGSALEEELPETLLWLLLLDSLAVGGLMLLAWPLAALVVLFCWRRDRRLAVPAVFFLAGDALFFLGPHVGLPRLVESAVVACGWVFVITAIRTWFLWLRGRP